jgi:hypothetical protein
MRVTAKYSHNHSEEAAACNLYKLHDRREIWFPTKDLESKGKCSKGHTIGIVVVANGNVEAVRLRT